MLSMRQASKSLLAGEAGAWWPLTDFFLFLFFPPAESNGLDWNTGLLPDASMGPTVLSARWHWLRNLEHELFSSWGSKGSGQRWWSGPKELRSEKASPGAPGKAALPLFPMRIGRTWVLSLILQKSCP